jgi:N-hydroxyarylamine O-acetyltransferase
MDIRSYLDRIHYQGPVAPTHEALCALQRAHMLAVPFENLDIVPLHRPINLDEGALWNKIVVRRRGGFCYELNGMFAWLLRQIGFQVTYLNARVFGRDGRLGPDFDHLALLVETAQEKAWLADVGFGDSFVEPLDFSAPEHDEGPRAYRLEKEAAGWATWQQDYDGNWERMYFFDLVPRKFPAEYEAACLYQQRSPESHFTHQSVVSRLTENGRITLESDKLIVTEGGVRHETAVAEEEWPLKEHFGIAL